MALVLTCYAAAAAVTGYWAFSVAYGMDSSRSFISLAKNPLQVQPNHTEVTKWSPLFNALTLLNYVLSDGIVVWRAWIICRRDHRKYLWITIFFLVLTAITVFLTILFRVIALRPAPCDRHSADYDAGHVPAVKSNCNGRRWCYGMGPLAHDPQLRFLRAKAGSLRTNHILLLVVESGVFYCLSAIMVLLSSLIRLPEGTTLGDLYTPVNVQIAGAYPTIVILLASTTRSLSESSFTQGDDRYASQSIRFNGIIGSTSTPNQPSRIQFASNPALSSGSVRETLDILPEKGRHIHNLNRLSDDSSV
ncbi:hypothetical protein C8R46DRAFT_1205091 [Mycena filopes]|nr:hypothetical protein C8R46DRAFT_1205091 [Mycena filopes]